MARLRSQLGLDSVDNAEGTTPVPTQGATTTRRPRFVLNPRETLLHTRRSEDRDASAYSDNYGVDPSERQREMSPEIIPNPFRRQLQRPEVPEDDSE
jgi:hypothetical protein